MKKLSRDEMKKVMGGKDATRGGGGGVVCQNDSDCGDRPSDCGTLHGRCYANQGTTTCTCHWAGCVY